MVGALLPYVNETMSELKLAEADDINLETFYDGQSKQVREDKLEVDRWTNYGHDRLYINAGISKCDKYSLYVDLQTHEIVSDNDGKHKGGSVEIDGSTAEITIIESGVNDKEHVITVSLEGEDFEAADEDDADDEDDDKTESEEVEKAKRVRARIHKYARAGNHRLAENSASSYEGIPGETGDEPKLVADGGGTKTERDVELTHTDSGHYVARVTLMESTYNEQYGAWEPSQPERVGQYAFVPLDADWVADRIRGEVVETEGTPAGYIGNSTGKHYYQPADHDELPADVLAAMRDAGLTLVDGFEGGWADWDGRPEWSESYLDVSETSVVAGAQDQ